MQIRLIARRIGKFNEENVPNLKFVQGTFRPSAEGVMLGSLADGKIVSFFTYTLARPQTKPIEEKGLGM